MDFFATTYREGIGFPNRLALFFIRERPSSGLLILQGIDLRLLESLLTFSLQFRSIFFVVA